MLADLDTRELTQIEPRIVFRGEHRKRFLSKGSARPDKLSTGLEAVPILFYYGIHPARQTWTFMTHYTVKKTSALSAGMAVKIKLQPEDTSRTAGNWRRAPSLIERTPT